VSGLRFSDALGYFNRGSLGPELLALARDVRVLAAGALAGE